MRSESTVGNLGGALDIRRVVDMRIDAARLTRAKDLWPAFTNDVAATRRDRTAGSPTFECLRRLQFFAEILQLEPLPGERASQTFAPSSVQRWIGRRPCSGESARALADRAPQRIDLGLDIRY